MIVTISPIARAQAITPISKSSVGFIVATADSNGQRI
jgi:hypothetical protein